MKRDLDQLEGRRFDLLVIGGGITGAGVALEATLRGWQVALIDKGDFAGGTSSVSSKLIHGGLRYLEHGHFRLVREALHERRRLLRSAPHLVWPLRFVVPVYRGARVPRWQLRLGLTIYDLLAGSENLRRSGPLTRRDILTDFPQLRTQGLVGGADYFDAQMEDARLCIEVIKTAAERGACAANYVEAVGFERRGGTLHSVRAVDRTSGRELTITARQTVNATGPWVDALCRLAGDPSMPHLRPTKGAHIILPDQNLPAALLLLHPRDGRVFFVIPWLGRTLVGTTDTLCDESPDQLTVTADEIDYLLEGYGHFFPAADRSAVINTFVGLRPLIRQKPGQPSSLSREFQLFRSPSGLLSVAGGKYTTYRSMAETIVNEMERGTTRSATRNFKLDGTPKGDWLRFRNQTIPDLQAHFGLSEPIVKHLVQRYGRRAVDVAQYIERDPKLAGPIIASEPDSRAELVYQREQEMAIYPEDHLLRRTRLGLFHPEFLAFPQNLGKDEATRRATS